MGQRRLQHSCDGGGGAASRPVARRGFAAARAPIGLPRYDAGENPDRREHCEKAGNGNEKEGPLPADGGGQKRPDRNSDDGGRQQHARDHSDIRAARLRRRTADDLAEDRRHDHPRAKPRERAAGEAHREIRRSEGQSRARPEDGQSRDGNRPAAPIVRQRPEERTRGCVRQGVCGHEEGGERGGSAPAFEYFGGDRGHDHGVAAYEEGDGAAQNHGRARCSRAVPFPRGTSSFVGRRLSAMPGTPHLGLGDICGALRIFRCLFAAARLVLRVTHFQHILCSMFDEDRTTVMQY